MLKLETKKWIVKRICLFFVLLCLYSCSFYNPEISDLSVKILKIETDTGRAEERLSVFLMYKDENGRNDYSSINIVHLETGLTWTLNRENSSFFTSSKLIESESEKILWAGSNKIAYPFGKVLLGEYSITIEDLSGNRVIKKTTIKDEAPLVSFPFRFQIIDKKWNIKFEEKSNLNKFSIILLGADKQPLFVQNLPNDKYEESLGPLLEKYPDARYIQAIAQNVQGSIAYLTKYHSLY